MQIQEAVDKLKNAIGNTTEQDWGVLLEQLSQDPEISGFIALVKRANLREHLLNVSTHERRSGDVGFILEKLAHPAILFYPEPEAAVRFVLVAEQLGFGYKNLASEIQSSWSEMMGLPVLLQHGRSDDVIKAFLKLKQTYLLLEKEEKGQHVLKILKAHEAAILERKSSFIAALRITQLLYPEFVFFNNPALLEKLINAVLKMPGDFSRFHFDEYSFEKGYLFSEQQLESLLDKIIQTPDPKGFVDVFERSIGRIVRQFGVTDFETGRLYIKILLESAFPVEMADFLLKSHDSELFSYATGSATEYNENIKDLLKSENILFAYPEKTFHFGIANRSESGEFFTAKLLRNENQLQYMVYQEGKVVIKDTGILLNGRNPNDANKDLEFQKEVVAAIRLAGDDRFLIPTEKLLFEFFLNNITEGMSVHNVGISQYTLDALFSICKNESISQEERQFELMHLCLQDAGTFERACATKSFDVYTVPVAFQKIAAAQQRQQNAPVSREERLALAREMGVNQALFVLLRNSDNPTALQKIKDCFAMSWLEDHFYEERVHKTDHIVTMGNVAIIDAWFSIPIISLYVVEHREYEAVFDAFLERKMAVFEQSPEVPLRELGVYLSIITRLLIQNTEDSIRRVEALLRVPDFLQQLSNHQEEGLYLHILFGRVREIIPEVAERLHQIPEVAAFSQRMHARMLAEAARNQQAGVHSMTDIQRLAQDQESSMHVVTAATKAYLQKAADHYWPMITEVGADTVFEELKGALKERYIGKPAFIFRDNGEKVFLPLEWGAFQALQLTGDEEKRAFNAYYRDKNHSALRYLMEDNPWMHPNAVFRTAVFDEDGHRSADLRSNYEYFKPEILIRWMAAKDPDIGIVDGFDTPDRIDALITELAFMARAHNWDGRRPQRKYIGDEYAFSALGQENTTSLAPLYLAVREGHLVYSVLDQQGALIPVVWTEVLITPEQLATELAEPGFTHFKRKILRITTENGHTEGTLQGNKLENYDDLKEDNPTCIPGAEGRLSQATLGHPLFMLLTEELVRQVINEEMKEHFKGVLAGMDLETVKVACEDMVINIGDSATTSVTIMEAFNMNAAQQAALIEKLETRYTKVAFAPFKAQMEARFKVGEGHLQPNHAMAFYDAFEGSLNSTPSVTPVSTSPVSFRGVDSPSRPESPRSGVTPNYRNAGPLSAFERQQRGGGSPHQ